MGAEQKQSDSQCKEAAGDTWTPEDMVARKDECKSGVKETNRLGGTSEHLQKSVCMASVLQTRNVILTNKIFRVGAQECEHVCGGSKLIPGIFHDQSPFFLLKQILLLNSELTDSRKSLLSDHPEGSLSLHLSTSTTIKDGPRAHLAFIWFPGPTSVFMYSWKTFYPLSHLHSPWSNQKF